eukprot:759067-Hanusia_phi.AAC.9
MSDQESADASSTALPAMGPCSSTASTACRRNDEFNLLRTLRAVDGSVHEQEFPHPVHSHESSWRRTESSGTASMQLPASDPDGLVAPDP